MIDIAYARKQSGRRKWFEDFRNNMHYKSEERRIDQLICAFSDARKWKFLSENDGYGMRTSLKTIRKYIAAGYEMEYWEQSVGDPILYGISWEVKH